MLTVNITYHADTRLMEITSVSTGVRGKAIATTGDDMMTRLQFTFDDPNETLEGFGKRVEFGINLIDTDATAYKPFIVLDENDGVILPYSILSNVKCSELPIQLGFGKQIEDEKVEFYSLNILELAINKALDATAESPVERYPQVDDAIYQVSYDDSTATFTFKQIDGTLITINLSDLSEEHYEVQHYEDLDTLTEAESGDTATVLDTGVWYKLYIQHGTRNWYPMSGNTTINGTQTGTPVFYAPFLSGTSGQYLESRGENNSPEWITKITSITENSDTLPTTTAVKSYVDTNVTAERERAIGIEQGLDGRLTTVEGKIPAEASSSNQLADKQYVDRNEPLLIIKSNSTPFFSGVAELPDNATHNDYAYVTGVENNITFLDRYDFTKSGNIGQWTKKFRIYLMKNGQILNDWNANVDTSHIPSAKLTKDTIDAEVTRATGVESGLNNRISTLETETVNDGGRYLTKTNRVLDHDLTTRSDGSDTAILTNGGTSTFIDSLSSNETGHVTASNTKTVTLPKVTAGTGITITDDDLPSPDTGKQIIVGHSNSINAHTDADVGSGNLIPIIRNDAQGHLTKVDSTYVNIPTSQVTSLTGYSEASSEGQLATTDTLNQALGKIQKGINSKARTNHADGSTDFGRATTSLYGHVKIVTATNTPSGTSNENVPTEAKMAEFVNSSIASQTGKFVGTVDAETDLGLTLPTTNALIADELLTYYQSESPTNNDYCYVTVDTEPSTPSKDEFRRFKYNGTSWQYEYTLNNSSFTQTQWATINSLLTNRSYGTGTEVSLDVVDIDANITASTTHIADTDIHVTTSDKSDWNAKYDKPSTGIPKTDLAQSVQDSLSLADSSLQAHQPIKTINSTTMVGTGNVNLQVPLVGSGTGQNIKTVGGTNILGTGDIPFPTVVNSNPTLDWATKSKVGSVGSTDLEVTMPSNPVIKTAIESALNVSATYNNQALIVKNGVLDFGEAGKVDDVRINGSLPANSIVNNKIAVIPITVTDVHITEID